MDTVNVKATERAPRGTRPRDLQAPPIDSLQSLIALAKSGEIYKNINMQRLWSILPQLEEIHEMIGLEELKRNLCFHVVYYISDLFQADNDYLHTIITGPPGSGKCFARGTPIRLFDGSIKTIEQLNVNDVLIGDTLEPRVVLSTSQGYGKMYTITDNLGCQHTVNSSHIITVHNGIELVDMHIQEAMNDNTLLLCKMAYEPHVIEPIQVDAYCLGYLMARRHNIGIITPNIQGLFASFDFGIYQNTYSRLEHFDTSKISRSQLVDFISGVYDAIATRCGSIATVNFSPDRQEFMNMVIQACRFAGIPAAVQKHTHVYTILDEQYESNVYSISIEQWYDYIYSRVLDIHSVSDAKPLLVPFTIVECGEADYYGLTIEGNGRFLLADGTITHNTTIARIIGEMYKNMNILSPDGVFRVAKREDFVAEYLGQTAIKTKNLLESCIGGVLFIDEVYALGSGSREQDSFSKEAIDTLNVFLSEHSHDFCCIIAGYSEDIQRCFFSVNQGLERRFPWKYSIESYSTVQLVDMFYKLTNDARWTIASSVSREYVRSLFEKNKHQFQYAGGDIENFISKCKMAHAMRIISQKDCIKRQLDAADIKNAFSITPKEKERDAYNAMYL